MPVSRTEQCSVTLSPTSLRTATLTVTLPRWVNLTALFAKFISTCSSRSGSPRNRLGASGAITTLKSSCFSLACAPMMLPSRLMTWCRSKSTFSRAILPASILEKSRMSLRIFNSSSAESLILARYSRCCFGDASSPKRVNPRIAFIGVRISWLMLAKNSLLA